MKRTAVVYGSTTGNTESAAREIVNILGPDASLFDISKADPGIWGEYDNFILGTSTWGYGDMQDDWDSFLPELSKLDLKNKTVALFGLGDASSYPETFVDAMGTIYETLSGTSANVIGSWSDEGYTYSDSKAVKDGKFVGLALDEDNESDRTADRIKAWIESLRENL